ncbi:Zinc finger protein bud20 [Penicillium longicatenatum]|uniref:Zinc finger protein bud20 n=1 Tax=Penicillium longicatenatum TaxID=1561947 RepID=UPI002549B6F5|nr:Zinc finger protein bud20 [Penicillium longicatenatum]KAJ5630963.1 Zinc finger protein bud20 [Penicillium longicatenatum]KAJ5659853.1 Zinc finger protein bud20 [Penicillium longicatenatum]
MGALRRVKNKRRTRDYDQVIADIQSPRHLELYKESKDVEDLPGLGQHFCTECSKWFESDYNLKAHTKGKNHKRRVKILKEEPHSQKIAEAVVGLGVDNFKRPEKDTEMEI